MKVRARIHAQHGTTVLILLQRLTGGALIPGAEVYMATVEGGALGRVRQIGIMRTPGIPLSEWPPRVVAQHAAVVPRRVVSWRKDDVSAIESGAIIADRIEPIRATGIEGFPRGGIVEVTVRVTA